VSRFPRQAAARGYIVVTPQAVPVDVPLPGGNLKAPLWNIAPAFVRPPENADVEYQAGDDVAFLLALLDDLEQRLCIDTTREYVSGLSNGAGMSVMLICTDDQRFAAAAPVAGVNMGTLCAAEHATPTIAFHGDADELVPYGGGSIFGYDLGLPPVEQRMMTMATLGGCEPRPRATEPFTDIRHFVWKCPAGMAAELYTVVGGGHTWPGAPARERAQPAAPQPRLGGEPGYTTKSVDATDLILEFFDAQQRQSPES
jgi:polyhydroxybutyrate depolymerase